MHGADSKPKRRAQCRPEKSEKKIQSRHARPWRFSIKGKKEGEYTRGRDEEEHIGRNKPDNEQAAARLVLGTSRH